MPRELSQAEKDYITANHEQMSPEAICADMPGVGAKTVESFIETSILPAEVRDESHEERQKKLRKCTGLTAGKLMGRDPDRGIATMTAGASQMSDANRGKNMPTHTDAVKAQESRIYIMDPDKKVH